MWLCASASLEGSCLTALLVCVPADITPRGAVALWTVSCEIGVERGDALQERFDAVPDAAFENNRNAAFHHEQTL
jgi:hypothetical protein